MPSFRVGYYSPVMTFPSASPAPLRGIFFDLDDTLIGYDEAERRALAAGGRFAARLHPAINAHALTEAIAAAYAERYEYQTPGYARLAYLSVAELRADLTRDALLRLGLSAREADELTPRLIAEYEATERDALQTFADAHETLALLRPHFTLGVITNGPSAMQREKLARFGLSDVFDVIVVDTEFGHPKPDPRIFDYAARSVNLSPNALMFVGNSWEADVAGACASGWTSVWLNASAVPPPRAAPFAPHHVIGALGETLQLPEIKMVVGGSLAGLTP